MFQPDQEEEHNNTTTEYFVASATSRFPGAPPATTVEAAAEALARPRLATAHHKKASGHGLARGRSVWQGCTRPSRASALYLMRKGLRRVVLITLHRTGRASFSCVPPPHAKSRLGIGSRAGRARLSIRRRATGTHPGVSDFTATRISPATRSPAWRETRRRGGGFPATPRNQWVPSVTAPGALNWPPLLHVGFSLSHDPQAVYGNENRRPGSVPEGVRSPRGGRLVHGTERGYGWSVVAGTPFAFSSCISGANPEVG